MPCFGSTKSNPRATRNTSLQSDRSGTSGASGSGAPPDDIFEEQDDRNKKLYEELFARIGSGARELTTIVSNKADAFVNLSFLDRGPSTSRPADAAQHLVRRVSSVSRPDLEPVKASQLSWSVSRRVLEDAIHTQAAADQGGTGPSCSGGAAPDLRSEEVRLRDRLRSLKLDMYVMRGDGNCQFRSLSFGLYGTEEYHVHVRRRAIAYMREHPADFEAFLGEEYGQYLDSMARSRTWGDELTLRAVCEAFDLNINVITSTPTNWFLRYAPDSGIAQREVFLTYISPIHYNAVRRRTSLAPLRESFKLGRQGSAVERAYRQALAADAALNNSGSSEIEALSVV